LQLQRCKERQFGVSYEWNPKLVPSEQFRGQLVPSE
jgi:hypothetical protein